MLPRIYLAATSLFLFAAPVAHTAGLRGACLLVSAAALITLLVQRRTALPLPLPRALLAALVAWAVLAIASTLWSVNPTHTLSELRSEVVYAGGLFAVFYIGGGDASRWPTWHRTMLAGVLLLAIAENIREAFVPHLGWVPWHAGVGAFSTHLALIAPLLLALRWSPPWGERAGVAPFAIALGLLFAAAWDTQNRILWVSFLASFVVAGIARGQSELPAPAISWQRHAAVLAIASVILALFAVTTAQRSRIYEKSDASVATALQKDLRPLLWSTGASLVEGAPFLGHGFGRQIAAPVFRPLTPPVDHPGVIHAHNMFLNVAIQLGLAGLAIFIAILALIAWEFRQGLRRPGSAPAAILGLGVLAGFVAKNITDDFLFRHNGLVFWALMGMLLGLSRRRPSSVPPPSVADEPRTAAPAPSA